MSSNPSFANIETDVDAFSIYKIEKEVNSELIMSFVNNLQKTTSLVVSDIGNYTSFRSPIESDLVDRSIERITVNFVPLEEEDSLLVERDCFILESHDMRIVLRYIPLIGLFSKIDKLMKEGKQKHTNAITFNRELRDLNESYAKFLRTVSSLIIDREPRAHLVKRYVNFIIDHVNPETREIFVSDVRIGNKDKPWVSFTKELLQRCNRFPIDEIYVEYSIARKMGVRISERYKKSTKSIEEKISRTTEIDNISWIGDDDYSM